MRALLSMLHACYLSTLLNLTQFVCVFATALRRFSPKSVSIRALLARPSTLGTFDWDALTCTGPTETLPSLGEPNPESKMVSVGR